MDKMECNAIVDADTGTRRLLELMQAILSAADGAELDVCRGQERDRDTDPALTHAKSAFSDYSLLPYDTACLWQDDILISFNQREKLLIFDEARLKKCKVHLVMAWQQPYSCPFLTIQANMSHQSNDI